MNAFTQITRRSAFAALAAVVLLAGCATVGSTLGVGGWTKVSLSGAQEVPPVTTAGSGSGALKVEADGSVSGKFSTKNVPGLAAHIHVGAAGKNGPVAVPLKKTGDNEWSVPEGAKLNSAQMAAYKAGELYVNVHTAAHKGGEVRGQIKP